MSLKGIELQIAIPKTVEVGKLVQQTELQVLAHQMHANELVKREVNRKQTVVNMSEKNDALDVNEESETTSMQSDYVKKNKKKHDENSKEKASHPFKGNFVDFSG